MSHRPNYVHPRVEALESALAALTKAMLETHRAITRIADTTPDRTVANELTESAQKILVQLDEAVAQIVGRAP